MAQLVEQRIRNARVKGSSPFIGSIRGVAQFGSAFGSGPKGRGFKSRRPDQKLQRSHHDFAAFLLLNQLFISEYTLMIVDIFIKQITILNDDAL